MLLFIRIFGPINFCYVLYWILFLSFTNNVGRTVCYYTPPLVSLTAKEQDFTLLVQQTIFILKIVCASKDSFEVLVY